DINNWQLIDKAEQIKINLGLLKETKIKAGQFILLERTDDDSAPNVPADLIYSNTLNNSDEGLRLFDSQCNLVDEVLANPNWPAGDNTQKRTMERSPDLSWHTYNGTAQNNIFGTPKRENSAPTVIASGGGGGGGNVSSNQQPTTNSTSTSSPAKILINEIQITGGEGKPNNDFIELYNPNNFQVNLKSYRLVKRTQTGTSDVLIKSWTSDTIVAANSYYLWANNDYTDISITPDTTTSVILSNNYGVAIRYGSNDSGTVIDSVAWGEAQNNFIENSVFPTNPTANQSIQRKIQNNTFTDTDNNAQDFEIQSCPSPKAPSGNCQSATNQAPSAFFVYTPQNPTTNDLITFDAASSTDSDGTISVYQWDFGDNATSSISTATTTHTYPQTGNYSVNLIVFDNQNASSTATSTTISISASGANHLVISEIMAGVGTGRSDEEFIEIYNPTDVQIDLTSYFLKRKNSATATSTQTLVKTDDFQGRIIPAKGFFLIASPEYNATTTPDVRYSYSYRLANTDDVVILYNNNDEIIDEVAYQNIPASKSLERKAWQNNQCLSSQLDGEFLGNGCDKSYDNDDDNNTTDFEIRQTPNPQNSSSLPEPRNAPTAPQNFTIQYSSSTMELNFNWDASQDYNSATSTLTYKLSTSDVDN
ncbi:MAG: lamin tail domain-containing protein, partial [Candidatus Subteraquimicrobiales bacterium]|nr:lamin tail domain-containing protein [Candidatus Subteraquimicrobiales bacterium]